MDYEVQKIQQMIISNKIAYAALLFDMAKTGSNTTSQAESFAEKISELVADIEKSL